MVPANKILTVTYGTFSCTLEGFEDPFTAMTEIAEYFRDLAAKDRYFGAEPPTPDMQRLEQITAASMNGPVSADDSSGRLVLRPGEAEPDLLAAVEDQVAEEKTSAEQRVEGQGDGSAFEDSAVEDEASAEDGSSEPVAGDDDIAETASAKLARLRGAATTELPDAGSYDYDEDEFASDEEPAHDAGASQADISEADAADLPEEDGAEPEGDDLTDAGDSADSPWAEDMARRQDAEDAGAKIEDMPLEAEPAEAETPEANIPEADAVGDAPDMTAASDENSVAPDEDVAEEEDGGSIEDADLLQDFAEDEDPVETMEDDGDVEDDVEAGHAESGLVSAPTDSEDEAEAAEIESTQAAEVSGVIPEEAEAETVVQSKGEDTLAADLAAMFSPRAEEEPEAPAPEQPAARVTVRKVRKRASSQHDADLAAPAGSDEDGDEDADLMAELAAIEAELARDATGATAPETSDADDVNEPRLSEDDDDTGLDDPDLMSELAAIKAAASPDAVPATKLETMAEDDAEEIEDAEATEAEPNDLERLFAATDSRLSGEDASRRHANISHLKAAVAARRADDTIETEKTDGSGAYRKDLANTVRPRRKPAETGDAAEESRPERGAPLVLISEQRVEPAPEPLDETPAAKAPEVDIAEGLSKGLRAPDTGDDFEQFAIDVGAVDLPDVLEAAAVYSATVMGQESFSRPRLLHLAAEAVDDLSREDGLRGFGQLLRDGTIRKVGRGTFTLGTESRFQTKAARRAG